MNRHFPISIFAIAAAVVALMTVGGCSSGRGEKEADNDSAARINIAFNEDSAMASIQTQCAFGPRVLGSQAHARCADYIEQAFRAQGLEVSRQNATFTLYNGQKHEGCNIIARYTAPANNQGAAGDDIPASPTDRIMICAHWDSRPWADNDPDEKNHHSPVAAANDGASGVAVMIELARQLRLKNAPVNVDFVCFDAEDAGVPDWDTSFTGEDEDTWCLGSQYWAQHPHTADIRFAILLDMVGGKGARFYKERFSMMMAPGVQTLVWQSAKEAGYGSLFPDEVGGYITDDHLPINRIARIPCVDIIAYDPNSSQGFPATWHTLEDTPAHIDPSVLKAVGQTLIQVIYSY